jgi:ribosomal-protein-alanine N-acetyltransferase
MLGLAGAGSSGPVLSAQGLELRTPAPREWPSWAAVAEASRERLERWQPAWPEGYVARAAYDRRCRLWRARAREGSGFAWNVWDGDRLVGHCRLSPVRRGAAMTATLGYWVAEGEEGQGVATRAAFAACAHAFETLGLERVEASYVIGNAASARVLAKLGFAEEGSLRGALLVAGERRDHVLVARLRG